METFIQYFILDLKIITFNFDKFLNQSNFIFTTYIFEINSISYSLISKEMNTETKSSVL